MIRYFGYRVDLNAELDLIEIKAYDALGHYLASSSGSGALETVKNVQRTLSCMTINPYALFAEPGLMRCPEETITSLDIPIVYTCRQAKKAYLDKLGVEVDVWVDNDPHFIFTNAG